MTTSSAEKMTIGIPCEDFSVEKRIAFTPNTVRFLTNNGVRVFVEKGAGEASFFSDIEYSESGAEIFEDQEAVFKADVIVKISPPTEKQITFLRKNQVLISSLNVRTLDKSYFEQLSKKKITAIALEYIKDEFLNYPFVYFMSEITGKIAINVATNYLKEKKGKLIGGFGGHKPSEIIIIGAGDVAQSVAKEAVDAGASVKVFDNSISRLKEFEQRLKYKVFCSVLYPSVLEKEFARADVVVAALAEAEGDERNIISNDLLSLMKKNSLIIDLSIDQGSCFEDSNLTSFKKPLIEKGGVVYYGVPNVPSTVPRTASYVLGNIFLQQFSKFQNYENINQFIKNDINSRNGLYLYNGIIVNNHIAEIFDLPSQDINLILAAF